MSQSDLNIANVSRSLFRQEVNKALQALGSLSSGATKPTTTYAYQLWADTGSGLLKQRNAANNGWINKGNLADVDWGFLNKAGGSMSGLLQLDQSTNIAAAATTNLGTATGNAVTVTHASGTLAITSLGGASLQAGTCIHCRLSISGSGLSLTYNATSLKIVGGEDLMLVDGMTFDAYKIDSSNAYWSVENINGLSKAGYTPTLIKPSDDSPCFIKTSATALSIKEGTSVFVAGTLHTFLSDTAVTMPTHSAGTDYSIWVAPDGTAEAVPDTFSSPASAPVADAVKIGGYHYGLVGPTATVAGGSFSTSAVTSSGGSFAWTQADVDKIRGINEFTIWDLAWRCKGDQYGMTYEPLKQMWVGIYFVSDSPHVYGDSAYNTNVASGTVLPYIPAEWGGNGSLKYNALNSFNAHELLSSHGHRLPTYDEFMAFAFGVTEAQSPAGSVTIPSTARVAGYTSRIGVEQATGHQWAIGGPIISSNGSSYASAGRGSWYGSTSQVLLGGSRGEAAVSGSRAASFRNALSNPGWSVSVRAASDHLNLGRAAR